MSRPRFTQEAAEDYAAAVRWHESERKGRGGTFRLHIEAALDHIQHRPESFPTVLLGFRRIVVRHFPYTLFYRLEAGQLVVHAVFHTSQDPSSVRGRLSDA